MDIWLLNSTFQKIAVIDTYKSFVWTERFYSYGDFKLVLENNATNRNLLKSDLYLSIPQSDRIMVIEGGISGRNDDGERIYSVSGRSAEALLDRKLNDNRYLPDGWSSIGPGSDLTVAGIIRWMAQQSGLIGQYLADVIDNTGRSTADQTNDYASTLLSDVSF